MNIVGRGATMYNTSLRIFFSDKENFKKDCSPLLKIILWKYNIAITAPEQESLIISSFRLSSIFWMKSVQA